VFSLSSALATPSRFAFIFAVDKRVGVSGLAPHMGKCQLLTIETLL
jgi:hypothetical protein